MIMWMGTSYVENAGVVWCERKIILQAVEGGKATVRGGEVESPSGWVQMGWAGLHTVTMAV